MKLKLVSLVAFAVVTLTMVSCLNTDSTGASENPNITSFSLKGIGQKKFSSVSFTIDNTANTIYNADSLGYLSQMDSVIVTITGASLSSVYFNDSLKVTSGDTVNFTRFGSQISVLSHAQDVVTSKLYTLDIRIHQIDPDLYQWKGLVSQFYNLNTVAEKLVYFDNSLHFYVYDGTSFTLFTSTNGSAWSQRAVSGLPTSVDIEHIVEYGSKLYVADNGVVYTSSNGITWDSQTSSGVAVDYLMFAMNGKLYGLGDTSAPYLAEADSTLAFANIATLPTPFPVGGAGICVGYSVSSVPRAFVVGGEDNSGNLLNTVWATENGRYWTNLSGPAQNLFSPRRDMAVLQYDSVLMAFGGFDGTNIVSDAHLVSYSYGINWTVPNAKVNIGSMFTSRRNANAVVGEDYFIYVISGRNNGGFVKDVWSGRKNDKVFN